MEEIVQLKKAYEDDSHVHLVMDLCTGGSLFDKIESFQERDNHAGDGHFEHFTEERVRLIMRRVLHMILKCHRRGIIYRDIKPQNFLYVDDTPSSDIKCSDYGLAMTYIPDNPEGLLLTKRAGTPAYMAPEVVLRRYNEKADLWGAGMLMYQLLAGRFPFWGGGLSISSTMDDIFFDIFLTFYICNCLLMVCAASHRRDELRTTTAHSDTIKLSVDSMVTEVTQKIMYYNAKGYD